MSSRLGVINIVKPKRKSAPYPFILEALTPLEPEVRPMFSGFAVYLADKIVLMLRDSPKQPKDNGVWLVFSEAANLTDADIRRDFPSLRLIGLLGGKIAHWLLIPADSPTFEPEALHACELLIKTRRAVWASPTVASEPVPSQQAVIQCTCAKMN
jgi:hypothetical protein